MSKHSKPDGRKPRRHERTLNSYDRRPGNRQSNRSILIVCEGAETEPNYFSALRVFLKLTTVHVKIKERAGAPISVVEEAINQKKKREDDNLNDCTKPPSFDAVWCVFDVENPNHNSSFEKAVKTADKNGFHLAVSNPAFEFWYILHFEFTDRPFADGKETKTYLQNHIAAYHESMPIFDRLKDTTKKAIERSKKLLENHPQGNHAFPNPSTRVHLLVQEMIEMSLNGRELLK